MGLLNSLGVGRRGGAMTPILMGLAGLLAYRTLKGKGKLADMLGRSESAGSGESARSVDDSLSGGALGGGLTDLLDRFRQSGQESKAQSWVSTGPNQPIEPDELEQVLGEERIVWLVEQTGMPRDQLIVGLCSTLPDAVDRLTPDGRIPTDEELSRKA